MVSVIAALAALLALLAWFFWPSDAPRHLPAGRQTPLPRAGVEDEAELERAERDVQEAPDEHTVRDWGPGVQRPPI
jgi:hypothetical protein